VRVWEALLRIPPGALVAYKDVAEHLGKPKASRAVANAVAQNPISYLIPCHRVVRSTAAVGAFGGYGGGTARKKALHAREAAKP
jgi:AraC family transcriptional regulator of adaptative response/methylated-DNA-[protein]-cysteine methyltransferase